MATNAVNLDAAEDQEAKVALIPVTEKENQAANAALLPVTDTKDQEANAALLPVTEKENQEVLLLVTEQEDQEAKAASTEERSQVRKEDQEVDVAYAERESLLVKDKGRRVWLQGGIYTKTNHYIKQSYDYVPEHKRRWLTQYAQFECSYFRWIFIATLILCLISPSHYVFAFIMGSISFLFFLVYAQHMFVVAVTIPILLQLPHLPDNEMRLTNRLLEVTHEKYCSMFAVTPDTAVSVGMKSKGTIKIHVLSTRARNMVKRTRVFSVLAFGLSTFMYCYCFGLGSYLVAI